MIWTYFLPVETKDGVEMVTGYHLIHHASLECTEQPDVRKLIMDTIPLEHDALSVLALSHRAANQEEVDLLNAQEFPLPDPGFVPLNPLQGVEHRLSHVEEWLAGRFPPPP